LLVTWEIFIIMSSIKHHNSCNIVMVGHVEGRDTLQCRFYYYHKPHKMHLLTKWLTGTPKRVIIVWHPENAVYLGQQPHRGGET
jgi:hypothetical protein